MVSTTGGLVMLKEMLPKLPPSERKIASYIIANPSEVLSLTANELGKRSLTSSAAVIRLCKSLNLKGFQELKLRLAGDLRKPVTEGFLDIEPDESISSIIEKTTNNSIHTLRETEELLSREELHKAVEVLKKARRIHFIGVGASSIIAQDAQQKFLRIDKAAFAFADMHMATTSVANVEKNDVVVGISFSGQTPEVAKIMEIANKHQAHTISITKYGRSIVSEQADIQLYSSATKEPTFRSGATLSRMAQLHVVDILFMCVASSQFKDTVTHLETTRKAVEDLTGQLKDQTKQL